MAERSTGRALRTVKQTDVSVCIANYNGVGLLRQCLDSLHATSGGVAFEIIVIDNGSTDGSREMVGERYPAVTLIQNPTNDGYAAANNLGLERSCGRYILVLNNDTIVPPDCLEVMTRFMDDHPTVGMSTCSYVARPGSAQLMPCTNRFFPSARRVLVENLINLSGLGFLVRRMGLDDLCFGYTTDHEREHRVEQITGAFLFVRRQTIDQVGPMDPGYFLYLEETDWCYRIRQAGWEIAYTPRTHIVHLGSQTTQLLPNRPEIYRRSMERYLTKHRGRHSAWLYRMQVLLIERPLSPLFLWLRKRFRGGQA
ncbi:MAG: glycosyltransferase family 2 protein [Candidatus Riflebacteria bacterium]|nr:glycosyltransferase family 2 protein [Candidatus Riflebacteria bacterium]